MKKIFCFVAILLSVTLNCAIAVAGQGNNLPSGPRYMLNVTAFDNCPTGDFMDSNRHMIAVKANFDPYSDPSKPLIGTQAGKLTSDLIKTNTIALKEGSDFQVLDGTPATKGAPSSCFQQILTPVLQLIQTALIQIPCSRNTEFLSDS